MEDLVIEIAHPDSPAESLEYEHFKAFIVAGLIEPETPVRHSVLTNGEWLAARKLVLFQQLSEEVASPPPSADDFSERQSQLAKESELDHRVTFQSFRHEKVFFLAPMGEWDVYNAMPIRAVMHRVLRQGYNILIYMQYLRHLDSSGMGSILSSLGMANKLDLKVIIAQPPASIREIWELAHLGDHILAFDTIRDALRHLEYDPKTFPLEKIEYRLTPESRSTKPAPISHKLTLDYIEAIPILRFHQNMTRTDSRRLNSFLIRFLARGTKELILYCKNVESLMVDQNNSWLETCRTAGEKNVQIAFCGVSPDVKKTLITPDLNHAPRYISTLEESIRFLKRPEMEQIWKEQDYKELLREAQNYANVGYNKQALPYFRGAAELTPGSSRSKVDNWRLYGDCLQSLDRFEEAREVYQMVLLFDPNDSQAQSSLNKVNTSLLEAEPTIKPVNLENLPLESDLALNLYTHRLTHEDTTVFIIQGDLNLLGIHRFRSRLNEELKAGRFRIILHLKKTHNANKSLLKELLGVCKEMYRDGAQLALVYENEEIRRQLHESGEHTFEYVTNSLEEAIRILMRHKTEEMRKKFSKPQQLYREAEIKRKSRDFNGATPLYRAALELKDNPSPNALTGLLKRLRFKKGARSGYLFAYGLCLYEAERFEEAEETFRKCFSLYPDLEKAGNMSKKAALNREGLENELRRLK